MSKIFYTVYKITNNTNGKFYIGKHQTTNLNDNYMGSGRLIKEAIKKFGIESFKKEILSVFESERDMNECEAKLVTLNENSYNLTIGGKGGFSYINRTISPEKKQISKARQSHFDKLKNDPNYYHRFVNNTRKGQLGVDHTLWAKNNPDEVQKRMKDMCQKAQSDFAKNKRIETMKRNNHSQGIKNSQFGTYWITDGIKNKKIKNDENLPNGWIKGRI